MWISKKNLEKIVDERVMQELEKDRMFRIMSETHDKVKELSYDVEELKNAMRASSGTRKKSLNG